MDPFADMNDAARAFAAAPLERLAAGDAVLAYRRFGSGPPVLLVHGFPLHGFTWRKLLPALAARHACVVVDLPGFGDSEWTDATDFSFAGHARRLRGLADHLRLDDYALVAHDTGATIARCLARTDPGRVRRLAMINTEIPGHRPPWIREFQVAMRLPGAVAVFQTLLRSRAYRRCGAGFGGCFSNLDLLDGEFHDAFVAPCIADARRADGMRRYLLGIGWDVVDAMATWHHDLRLPVLLLWGEDDPTFPVERARQMTSQFPDCRGLHVIPRTKLLPHEERPDLVGDALLPFLA